MTYRRSRKVHIKKYASKSLSRNKSLLIPAIIILAGIVILSGSISHATTASIGSTLTNIFPYLQVQYWDSATNQYVTNFPLSCSAISNSFNPITAGGGDGFWVTLSGGNGNYCNGYTPYSAVWSFPCADGSCPPPTCNGNTEYIGEAGEPGGTTAVVFNNPGSFSGTATFTDSAGDSCTTASGSVTVNPSAPPLTDVNLYPIAGVASTCRFGGLPFYSGDNGWDCGEDSSGNWYWATVNTGKCTDFHVTYEWIGSGWASIPEFTTSLSGWDTDSDASC